MARDYNNPDPTPVISRHQEMYRTYDEVIDFISATYAKAVTDAKQVGNWADALIEGAEERVRAAIARAIEGELSIAEQNGRVRIKAFADTVAAEALEPIRKLALEVKEAANNSIYRNEELANDAHTYANQILDQIDERWKDLQNGIEVLNTFLGSCQQVAKNAAQSAQLAAASSAAAAASEAAASQSSREAAQAANIAAANNTAVAQSESMRTLEAGNFARQKLDVEETKLRVQALSERIRKANS